MGFVGNSFGTFLLDMCLKLLLSMKQTTKKLNEILYSLLKTLIILSFFLTGLCFQGNNLYRSSLFNSTEWQWTTWHYITLYCFIILCCIVFCCDASVLRFIVLHCIVKCCTVLCDIALRRINVLIFPEEFNILCSFNNMYQRLRGGIEWEYRNTCMHAYCYIF